jgi:uncharacterized membrane protein
MTEGPTPRDPRDEPPPEPPGAPPPPPPPGGAHEAPRWESPGTPPPPGGGQEAPRWESPGTPPPPPPPLGPAQGRAWEPGAAAPPPPPPPPPGGQGWGEPSGGYGYQQPGWGQPQGGYQGQPAAAGMAENVASGLSYVLTWVTGLIFFLVDRRPEVRFHAMQSIAFGVLWTLLAVIQPYMPTPVDLLFGLAWVAFFVGWIVLMIQGFQGRHFRLPVIGDFAEQQAGRPGL